MVAVFTFGAKSQNGKESPDPIARAWGDDGRVAPPARGRRYLKTVFVPIGAAGPYAVQVFWRPGKAGRRKFDKDLSSEGLFNSGVGSQTIVYGAGLRVRLHANFDFRHPDAPDPSQIYGIEELDAPTM